VEDDAQRLSRVFQGSFPSASHLGQTQDRAEEKVKRASRISAFIRITSVAGTCG
jgi:hypothetical protein